MKLIITPYYDVDCNFVYPTPSGYSEIVRDPQRGVVFVMPCEEKGEDGNPHLVGWHLFDDHGEVIGFVEEGS